ncbi:MAG: hypothetical protein J5I50_06050 [Chitinophagaceae bacterium]|nr:hypothetical protein [Chitinophagaceae bacterium]
MKAIHTASLLFALCISVVSVRSQVQPSTSPAWVFGASSGASFGMKSDEANMFRGTGIATKVFGRYFFGNIGLSGATGAISGTVNTGALNSFIKERGLHPEDLSITKGNSLNNYFLIGPAARFGNKLFVNAELQGGVFINSPGMIDISQKGFSFPVYKSVSSGENISPGFAGSVSINYPLFRSFQFFIEGNYLQSKSSVDITDPKSGIDMAMKVNRDVRLMSVGIGITKSFGNSSSKQSVKREVRWIPSSDVTKHDNDEDETNCGPVTQRVLNPDGSIEQMVFVNAGAAAEYESYLAMYAAEPRQSQQSTFGGKARTGLINSGGLKQSQGSTFGENVQADYSANSIAQAGKDTTKKTSKGNAGWDVSKAGKGNNPVTYTKILQDGRMIQMVFACVEDAAQYAQARKLRTPPTESYSPWEMDGESEGTVLNPIFESVNSTGGINGLNTMPSRLSKTPTTPRQTQGMDFGQKVAAGLQAGANAGVISGTIYWQPGNPTRIVTNEMASSGIEGAKPGETTLFARESGKGASQEMVINSSCKDCGITITGVKQTPDISQFTSQINPLYEDKGMSGVNPMYEASSIKGDNPLYGGNTSSGVNPLFGGKAMGKGNGLLCGSTSHFLVGLYDAVSGMQVARTTPDSCGNFWFANVPEGDYVVYVKGYALASRTYELSINKDGKYDVGGIMQAGNAQLMIAFQSLWNDSSSQNSKDIVSGGDPKNIEVIGGSQRVAGNPIPGLIVKGGKNPGPDRRTVMTNGNGQFGFSGWGKGNYIITTEIPFMVDQKAMVSVGKSVQQWGDPHENLNGKQVKGWDGSVKGNSITESQDYNSSRSNKVYFTINNNGGITGSVKAQDYNSSRSNTTASIIVIGNDGTVSGRLSEENFQKFKKSQEKNGNTSNSNKLYFTIDNDGNVTGSTKAQDYNSSRSNTRGIIIINNDGTVSGRLSEENLQKFKKSQEKNSNTSNSNKLYFTIDNDGNVTGSTKARDYNSSRSNTTASIIVVGNDGTVSGRLKEQDLKTFKTSREGNDSPDANKIFFTIGLDGILHTVWASQDYNSSRSNKCSGLTILDDGTVTGKLSEEDLKSFRIFQQNKTKSNNNSESKSPEKQSGQGYNSTSYNKANLTLSLEGVSVTGNALSMKLNPQEKVSSGSDKSYLIIGDDGSLSGKLNAQDFNTCRSNRERGQFARNSSYSNTASADKIFFRIGNDGSLTETLNVQNNNSGSGKADWSYLIINEDRTISGMVNAQDFNTCRSNRERGQFAKPTGDGNGGWGDPHETMNGRTASKADTGKISVTHHGDPHEYLNGKQVGPGKGNLTEILQAAAKDFAGYKTELDDLDKKLQADKNSPAVKVNEARFQIKNLKRAITDAENMMKSRTRDGGAAGDEDINYKMAVMDAQLDILRENLSGMDAKYSSVVNVLKTKHDTVKNSINNVR